MTYNININDYIGKWGFSKQYCQAKLQELKGKPVNVRISSYGGEVAHALDIRQQFIDHGDVTAYLYGFVASSATILAMGAKKICISKYCMFLVHKVSNWVDAWGQYNADQMQQLIEELKKNKDDNEKIDRVIASLYAAKCGKNVEEILDVLKEARWLTAAEAKDYGFVDEVIEGDEGKMNMADYTEKFNMLGLPPLPVPEESKENLEDETPGKTSVLNRILEAITGMRQSNEKKNEEPQETIKKIMNKDFKKVNELLGVEGFEANEAGEVTVTIDQLKKLNEKLDELGSKQTEIDSLKEQVNNLKKADGADSTVVDDDTNGSKITAASMFDEIKNL